MIVFNLTCSNDHTFEAWFKDSESFDHQVEQGLVSCPVCGDCNVRKAVSAPRLGGLSKNSTVPDMTEPSSPEMPKNPQLAAYLSAMREIKSYVEKNSDYVGEKFPEEARKIHYGETEARSIHGEASSEEAASLRDEGIEFHRIPWPSRQDA